MSHPPLMYETAWRCTHCSAAGIVTVSTADDCHALFNAVLAAHAAASPECNTHSGIALQPAAQGSREQ